MNSSVRLIHRNRVLLPELAAPDDPENLLLGNFQRDVVQRPPGAVHDRHVIEQDVRHAYHFFLERR